jgi:hypothetical protein
MYMVRGGGAYYLWSRWAPTMGSHFISINSTIDLGTGVSHRHNLISIDKL